MYYGDINNKQRRDEMDIEKEFDTWFESSPLNDSAFSDAQKFAIKRAHQKGGQDMLEKILDKYYLEPKGKE